MLSDTEQAIIQELVQNGKMSASDLATKLWSTSRLCTAICMILVRKGVLIKTKVETKDKGAVMVYSLAE